MHVWSARLVSVGLIVVVAVSVAFEVWLFPVGVIRAGEVFPEVHPFQAPAVVWGFLVISCWQVAILLTWRAVRPSSPHGRWRRAMGHWIAGALALATILSIAALATLSQLRFGTPGVMFGLILMALLAIVGGISALIAYRN